MVKNIYKKTFKWKRIYLTGAEIFALQKKNFINNLSPSSSNPKFVIGFSDGNFIQRDYREWNDEQIFEYKESLKNNFPHIPFYLLEKENQWYIVDGQHRFETILKIIEENDKDDDFWILKKYFEFIIFQHDKDDNWNFEKFGSHIFNILNNSSLVVSTGALYKALFVSKDKQKTKTLIEKYGSHFSTQKAKNSFGEYKRDQICDILANASFLIYKKYKIKDINSMKPSLIEYLTSNNFNEDSIKELLEIVEKFILKNVFNKDNKSIKKPSSQTLCVSFAIASLEKGIDKIKKFENYINVFEKDQTWKDSTKNTRTPHILYYKYKIINDSNSKNELIENTRKYLK